MKTLTVSEGHIKDWTRYSVVGRVNHTDAIDTTQNGGKSVDEISVRA